MHESDGDGYLHFKFEWYCKVLPKALPMLIESSPGQSTLDEGLHKTAASLCVRGAVGFEKWHDWPTSQRRHSLARAP